MPPGYDFFRHDLIGRALAAVLVRILRAEAKPPPLRHDARASRMPARRRQKIRCPCGRTDFYV